jgi:hypothetical protein
MSWAEAHRRRRERLQSCVEVTVTDERGRVLRRMRPIPIKPERIVPIDGSVRVSHRRGRRDVYRLVWACVDRRDVYQLIWVCVECIGP